MTTKELAQYVLKMFEEQQIYFKTKDKLQLVKCKKLESDLKRYCTEIVNPNLFNTEDE